MSDRHIEKGIAAALRAAAGVLPEEDCPTAPRVCFRFGRFAVRCRPYREAVLRVAEKYERGANSSSRTAPFTFGRAWADLRVEGPREWRRV